MPRDYRDGKYGERRRRKVVSDSQQYVPKKLSQRITGFLLINEKYRDEFTKPGSQNPRK